MEVLATLVSNMVNPIFKDIIFYNYLIDENGNIWSKKRKRFLVPYPNKDNYLQIRLFKDKKGISVRIASLVVYTFMGAPPLTMKSPTVDHKDGNRQNNHISNLQWLEHSKNASSRLNKKNSGGRGEKNVKSKLTENQVKKICELIKEKKMFYTAIAKQYGVSKSTISSIAHKTTWSFIANDYF